jgi:peptidoglycan-N-acetylglucosamine deacetylase
MGDFMKKKVVIIIAAFLLFTPLAFAVGYQTASFIYEFKGTSLQYQPTPRYSSGNSLEIEQKKQSSNSNIKPTSPNTTSITNKSSAQNSEKVVYLTFDDGPDLKVTPEILNVLKKYDVKATFFVVGNQIKGREEILTRIIEDGHSIGLHSWTHKYQSIYEKNENFISEMNNTFNEVKKVTGVETRIIRFPGGSSKRLTASLLDKLHSENFYIYDWNVTTGDGMYPKNSPEQLYKNLLSYNPKAPFRIVLMHNRGNNINTSKVLPKIIEHYQELGYRFNIIDENTPEYYFKIQSK